MTLFARRKIFGPLCLLIIFSCTASRTAGDAPRAIITAFHFEAFVSRSLSRGGVPADFVNTRSGRMTRDSHLEPLKRAPYRAKHVFERLHKTFDACAVCAPVARLLELN